jgi:putative FmdB family regulatory protein
MPTYDYKCDVCGSQREVAKEIGDESVPTCCQTSMTRVWSAIPAIFKTGGFYKTGG